MIKYRPGGAQRGIKQSYTPCSDPTNLNADKSEFYHRDLSEYEPMAWDFCLNFAKDNNLQVAEACLIPDEPAR
jgi:hypothetical protein